VFEKDNGPLRFDKYFDDQDILEKHFVYPTWWWNEKDWFFHLLMRSNFSIIYSYIFLSCFLNDPTPNVSINKRKQSSRSKTLLSKLIKYLVYVKTKYFTTTDYINKTMPGLWTIINSKLCALTKNFLFSSPDMFRSFIMPQFYNNQRKARYKVGHKGWKGKKTVKVDNINKVTIINRLDQDSFCNDYCYLQLVQTHHFISKKTWRQLKITKYGLKHGHLDSKNVEKKLQNYA